MNMQDNPALNPSADREKQTQEQRQTSQEIAQQTTELRPFSSRFRLGKSVLLATKISRRRASFGSSPERQKWSVPSPK